MIEMSKKRLRMLPKASTYSMVKIPSENKMKKQLLIQCSRRISILKITRQALIVVVLVVIVKIILAIVLEQALIIILSPTQSAYPQLVHKKSDLIYPIKYQPGSELHPTHNHQD